MATAPYAVVGATGQQGSAVVDALLDAGAPVRAIVRDPDAERSRALAGRGVELVRGDQEDGDAMVAALRGAAAFFLMTTFSGSDGVAGEERRGRTAAQSAARAGVPHVVYSSVGGAERQTGIPHFDSKRQVELALADLVPTKVVRPAFFMENFARSVPAEPKGEVVLRLPMPGDVPLQMVAVRDIGRVAAALLLDPTSLADDGIEIAGDERTGEQSATAIGEHLGVPARFEALPVQALGDDDQERMFTWFTELPAYRADFAGTRRLDPGVLDLPGWLAAR